MKTITLDRQTHALMHAASKNPSQYNLNGVYLDGKNSRAIATTGHILAVRKLEGIDPEINALMHFTKPKLSGRQVVETYELNGTANAKGNPANSCNYDADIQYPNIDMVVPAEKELSGTVVSLDAKKLWALAQAMGTEHVVLHLNQDENGPIQVTAGDHKDDITGVIMPMRIK